MSITSKGRGKSSGARVITYVRIVENTIFLIAIYDKSEFEILSDSVILERLKKLR